MSAADEREPGPGRDHAVGAAEMGAAEVGSMLAAGGSEVVLDPGPGGGRPAPVAGATGVAGVISPGGPEAPAGALQEEEGGQAAAPAGVQEGGSAEEDSDIGPADEEDQDVESGMDVVVDAHQFPMEGFRFIFLDLVHSLLHRIYYNHHILVRPHGGRVMMRQRPGTPEDPEESPAVPVPELPTEPLPPWPPQDPGEGPASWGAEGPAERNAPAGEPKKPREEAAGPEGEERAGAAAGRGWRGQRPGAQSASAGGLSAGVWSRRSGFPGPALASGGAEATKHQYENSDEEAQKAGGEEEKEAEQEKEKKNEKQGPGKDLNLAEGSP
ncbi:cancer/testis antigen family 47 member C1 [Dasypus novemcinctus]|uniref:cancer/testis antigen family 47 member C1 n=1 Tax=Dasypus novemcinctus TaxID=9361 RepID=UPI00062A69E8|nr:cancer/testis antigen family 47 member C1 [Dasypus novemcinctus]